MQKLYGSSQKTRAFWSADSGQSGQWRSLPGPKSQEYLERQENRESNARSYPRRLTLAIKKAKGIFVEDVDGNTYFDCLSGAGTLALGHNHPAVLEAMRQTLDGNYPLHTLDITTPIKDEFVELLFETLPPKFAESAKIQFCGPTGADAVEAALKLVKTATGNRSILSFAGGYHGMTHGALSVTGNLLAKEQVPGLMPDVHFLPYPYSYRCPFGLGGEQTQQVSAHYIENMLNDPESGIVKPAGMILESVQGEGGVIPAPVEWLQKMARITKERGIPLILDEVQTGIGRTGKFYGFEHAGITPDVVILSKALGGSLPLSVVLYNKELDVWKPGAHAGTFRGNQLAMAAGTATLKFILENNLTQQVELLGDRLVDHLREIQQAHPCLGDVRGRGLMVGAEIIDPELGKTADPKLAKQIQAECLQRGLIIELGGRFGTVVRFLPPLTITAEQIDTISEIFAVSVAAAEAKLA